jgi:hypothetical protein
MHALIAYMPFSWECDWNQTKRTDAGVQAFMKEHFEMHSDSLKRQHYSTDDLLYMIYDNEMHGFGIFDVRVPERYMDKFEEMGPFFINRQIDYDDIGPYMQRQLEEVRPNTINIIM